jgi:hypothetical protein
MTASKASKARQQLHAHSTISSPPVFAVAVVDARL